MSQHANRKRALVQLSPLGVT